MGYKKQYMACGLGDRNRINAPYMYVCVQKRQPLSEYGSILILDLVDCR